MGNSTKLVFIRHYRPSMDAQCKALLALLKKCPGDEFHAGCEEIVQPTSKAMGNTGQSESPTVG